MIDSAIDNTSGNASGNSTIEYLSRGNAYADVHASSEILYQTPTLMEIAICMIYLNGLITGKTTNSLQQRYHIDSVIHSGIHSARCKIISNADMKNNLSL